jgi:hypothetical protein
MKIPTLVAAAPILGSTSMASVAKTVAAHHPMTQSPNAAQTAARLQQLPLPGKQDPAPPGARIDLPRAKHGEQQVGVPAPA